MSKKSVVSMAALVSCLGIFAASDEIATLQIITVGQF